MSETVKIDEGSVCSACNETPLGEQVVKCFVCESHFHAVCEKGGNDDQLGSKTMVKTFGAVSTKANFKFFCDVCLTEYERNLVETQNEKITALTAKVTSMEAKLDEVTRLLKSSDRKEPERKKPVTRTCWDDNERLATIKAPKPKPQLVIKKSSDEEQSRIEETLIENRIEINESFKNREGDLVVVCGTDAERETVKNLVSTMNEDTVMRTPNERRPGVTIVGFPKEYTKEEIVQMLVLQNGFIKGFANQNDINDHIEIFAVRPLKNNGNSFQAFASVSATLREGIEYFKNRLTIGFTSCKVYDRYHVKRCNNCQHFGHYARDCPTPDEKVCGKCSGAHSADECTSAERKCANCVRDHNEQCDHHAFDFKCPSVRKQQETEKKKMDAVRLNYSLINQPIPR